MEQKWFKATAELKAESEGSIQAVFSVFDTIDSDNDVVMPSAFTDGQRVPMVWSHDWNRPVGRGTVKVRESDAMFDGRFFMKTAAGQEAYQTVKEMDDLQEWSFGFNITDFEYGRREGQEVRFLNGLTLFEVSPVLVGANRQTHTLAIKASGVNTTTGGTWGNSSTDIYIPAIDSNTTINIPTRWIPAPRDEESLIEKVKAAVLKTIKPSEADPSIEIEDWQTDADLKLARARYEMDCN